MKKSFTKFLSVLLMLIMTVSIIPTSVFTGFAVQSTEFYGGNGTEDYPYLISTKEHLDNMRLYPDAHYKLVKDIVFTTQDYGYSGNFYNSGKYWIPIENFTGVFDGNHHSIDGLKMNHSHTSVQNSNGAWSTTEYCGFFETMKGKVTNLQLSNINIEDRASRTNNVGISLYVGAIAGEAEGDILNCSVSGKITVNAKDYCTAYVGGIVGYAYKNTVDNCVNLSTVRAIADRYYNSYTYASGIVAQGWYGSKIKNCTNFGDIYSESYKTAFSGGIAGESHNILSTEGVIENCYNFGKVSAYMTRTSKADYNSYAGIAGGILANESQGSNTHIIRCANFAEIYARGMSSDACGIGLGEKIQYCFNNGSIISEDSSTNDEGFHYSAGISCYVDTIEECFNNGNVYVQGDDYLFAGGISSHSHDITNSYNTGAVSASETAYSSHAAGIASYTQGLISNCYNTGEISGAECAGITVAIDTPPSNDTESGVINCYYLDNCSVGVCYSNDYRSDTVKRSASLMQNQNTYKYFDFNNVWSFYEGDYPYPQLTNNKASDKLSDDICSGRGNHAFVKESVINESSCSQNGSIKYKCSVCETEKIISINAEHIIMQHPSKKENCTENGWDAYETCKICSYSTRVEIPATGHNYDVQSTAPTCTEQGYTIYTCECGDSYVADYVDETGHSHKSTITTPATHTSTGVMTYTCGCGDTYTEVIDKIAEHDHKAVVTPPTCTEKGYTTYTCECGDSYVSNYKGATGHDYDSGIVTTKPTCTQAGIKTFTCGNCGDTYTEEVKSLGHKHESTITTPATHLKEGVMTFTCGCGDTYTETIDKIATHNHISVVTDPTCTEQGYTTYTCECGNTYVDDYVDAAGHNDASNDGNCDVCTEHLCDHACHKTGITGFFWRIVCFFNRIFGLNKFCACGNAHY